mmetsp:Transcript_61982/g.134356  ORF Transcript_61982/g.134356 Transcript_61982/m.134356 type:complete len:780 (+) Transcript_61982:79-2418(+)|eukprot:CAMPEP_0170610990 /NCGR_PEP_ID=MMETSP0224-20130122/22952_1 /TAXON_ID=285029 /ORGANISM="Togula jolla, Strain CCCM 725" /LENGTH=779 /DNA_ID=CAMNT_0010936399 /DNA_START=74 /DNA_END=2413 /DNA_ORIENTATION=-
MDLDGRVVRFASAENESLIDLIAIKEEDSSGDDSKTNWRFKDAGDDQDKYMRIMESGKVNLVDGKGPLTKFILESQGPDKVRLKNKKTGLYLDLDTKSGDLKSSKDPATLSLILGPAEGEIRRETTSNFKERAEAARRSMGACMWQCCCGLPLTPEGLSIASTTAFWYSVGGALLTAFGSSLFWCGTWTMFDIDTNPDQGDTTWRDAKYVAIGVTISLLTNTLGIHYVMQPGACLKREQLARGIFETAEARAKDLEKMAVAAGESRADAPVRTAALRARIVADKKRAMLDEATAWWSRRLRLLTGDRKADDSMILRVDTFYSPVRVVLGLFGSVFLWVGACNLLGQPEGMIQGLIPDDYWLLNTLFDVCLVVGAIVVMQVSSTLGPRGGSEAIPIVKKLDCINWLVVLMDTIAGLSLWMGMCDLMGTRFATTDTIGMATDAAAAWPQLFYIVFGLLCQISTELIAMEAKPSEESDPWHLPSTYDIVSILGSIFFNNGVWVLVDTNIFVAWESCSSAGTLGPPVDDLDYDDTGSTVTATTTMGMDFSGWPTCFHRNCMFMFIGLVILFFQRQLMAEAGIYSTPLMRLAVKSVRKERQLEDIEAKKSKMMDRMTVKGTLRLLGNVLSSLGFGRGSRLTPEQALEAGVSLAGALADLVDLPSERFEAVVTEDLVAEVSIRPTEPKTLRFLNRFRQGGATTVAADQERVVAQLVQALSQASPAASSGSGDILRAVDRSTGFVVTVAPGKGKGGGKGHKGGRGGRGGKGKGKGGSDLEEPLISP